MTRFPFLQLDAFADRALAGNPCAVLFETDGLDTATMQAIARENNLSETAFVRQSDVADFGVRYFTPDEEVPLAGHPTIATAVALLETGRIRADSKGHASLSLELQVGPIQVRVQQQPGCAPEATMTQPRPDFRATFAPDVVVPCFGNRISDLRTGAPIQVVSTGTPQLMVPMRDRAALERVQVDEARYRTFRNEAGFFSTHLFVVAEDGASTFARHIVPGFEDPFTGSATGAMGAYVWHHGLIDQPEFVAEQGHGMGRPGRGRVRILGPRDDIRSVEVTGQAVVVIRGEFEL